jgi:DNA-binding MarR family transcriptional regulator
MSKGAANDYTLDPTLDFLRLLWGVEHGLQRMSKRMESSLGVTGPQRLVLRVVGRFPDLAAGEVARLVRLHPSTITGILQRLVDRGLLQRQRDEEDNRRVRLRLKPGAEAYTKTTRGTVEQAVALALTRVSRTQRQAARIVLAAIADALHVANAGDRRKVRRRHTPEKAATRGQSLRRPSSSRA